MVGCPSTDFFNEAGFVVRKLLQASGNFVPPLPKRHLCFWKILRIQVLVLMRRGGWRSLGYFNEAGFVGRKLLQARALPKMRLCFWKILRVQVLASKIRGMAIAGLFQRSRLRSVKANAGVSTPKEASLLLENSRRSGSGQLEMAAGHRWVFSTKHALGTSFLCSQRGILHLNVCCGYESLMGWEFALGV